MIAYVTPTTDSVTIRAPYHRDFVAAIKSEVPAAFRTYDPATRLWTVYAPFIRDARRIAGRFFEVVGDAAEPSYDAGYRDGLAAGKRRAPVLDRRFITEIITLTHPDHQPRERWDVANKVTAKLLELREAVAP